MPLLLSAATVIGIFVGTKLKNEPLIMTAQPRSVVAKPDSNDLLGQGRIEEIIRYVDAQYVEKVNRNEMVSSAVNQLLQELDPHSVYIPANEVPAVEEDLEGEFSSIGIEAMMLDDTACIVTPLSNSPATKAGLLSGDKIIAVGDSNAIGKDVRWLNNLLRGKLGTSVALTILRGEEKKPRQIKLVRDKITVASVEGVTMLDETTGYLKILRFSANTTKDFSRALDKLFKDKKTKDLVIDLRGNPGGYVDKAVDVLSQLFLERDRLLVFTKNKADNKNEYRTTGRPNYAIDKIAILIDEGSASAAEIVAGAVQDWDRGVIVGRRSFGKGLVQETYRLTDGSVLRLTVARYFTPSGRSIQRQYKGKSRKEYMMEEELRRDRGELNISEIVTKNDSLAFPTNNGRKVYASGGITPEVFVPIEGHWKIDYFHKIKGFTADFAYNYYVKNPKAWKYKTWQDFNKGFKLNDGDFSTFINYTVKKGVPRERSQEGELKNVIKKLIKSRIAKILFGEEGQYGVLNASDACVLKALDTLKKEDPLGLKKVNNKK